MVKRIVFVFIALTALVLLIQVAAFSQTKTDGPRVTIEIRNASIPEAMRILFKSNPKANFVIESGQDAMVPRVKLVDTAFDTAFKVIVRSAGLTYRMVDGVYAVSLKQQPVVIGAPPMPTQPVAAVDSNAPVVRESKIITEKIPLIYADVYDMAGILNGQAGLRASSIAMGSNNMGTGFPGGYQSSSMPWSNNSGKNGYGNYGSYGSNNGSYSNNWGNNTYPQNYGGNSNSGGSPMVAVRSR